MTTLFPSSTDPRHGVFVETRLRKLCAATPTEAQVIAPVPWFPSRWTGFGSYARFASTPRREVRRSLDVRHPRYLMIPKVGMAMQPRAVARAVLRELAGGGPQGARFDVIDAHYFYPDGVAAARVASSLGLPLVITARGSDVNLIATMSGPRKAILRAAGQAAAVIAVSQALGRALADLGVYPEKIVVLRNGVDTHVFRPTERVATRDRLGVGDRPLVLSVGNLVPEKGHDLIIAAVARLPEARLAIVGQGPQGRALELLAQRLGVAGRVTFLPNMPQDELAAIYSAADALMLASAREGWPNVLLEALACGTPVVATDVGGVTEIVREDIAGEVVSERSPAALALALDRVLSAPRQEERRVACAAAFDWESIAIRYFNVLCSAAAAAADRADRDRLECLRLRAGALRPAGGA